MGASAEPTTSVSVGLSCRADLSGAAMLRPRSFPRPFLSSQASRWSGCAPFTDHHRTNDVPLISTSLLDRVMVLIAAVQADHIIAAAAWAVGPGLGQ
jgi:hypothetical protein